MEHITTPPRTITKKDTWLATHAAALISFAEKNQVFGDQLTFVISQQPWKPTNIPAVHASSHLTPKTQTDATAVAHWLINTLSNTKEHTHTKALLSTWAASREVPQDFIIGIIGVSIMGPTLGIVESTKKKKKAQLQIVVEDTYFKSLTKTKLAKLGAQLGQAVFAHEIKLAGGNVYQLHPDTATWYIDDPELKLYQVDQATMKDIYTVAIKDNLITHGEYKNNQLVALAVSPSIDNALVEDYDALLV